MAFTFGNPPAAGAPAAAAPGAAAAPPTTGAPTGGFTFGAPAAAPQPAAAAAPQPAAPPPIPGPPSFGAAPSAATTTTTAAPAPTAGGFSFGGAPTATTAPATAAPTPVAPTGAPTFGGTSGGASFGAAAPVAAGAPAASTTTTAGTTTTTTTTTSTAAAAPLFAAPAAATARSIAAHVAPPTPAYVQVPEYNEIFPGEVIRSRIFEALARAEQGDSWAGQELVQLLSCSNNSNSSASSGSNDAESCVGHLLVLPRQDSLWKQDAPNPTIRQQLSTQQTVLLHDGRQEASLNPAMLQQVLRLADDLQISERSALTLYAHANANISQEKDVSSMEQRVEKAYFRERQCYLQTVLHLVQHRLRAANGDCVLQATDQLLQHGLVVNLCHLIRDYSTRVVQLQDKLVQIYKVTNTSSSASASASSHHHHHHHFHGAHAAATTPTSSMLSFSEYSTSDPNVKRQISVLQRHVQFGMQERQRAAECLFFIAYSTQLEAPEVVELVNLIRDLTNGISGGNSATASTGSATSTMKLLDPFQDVPDPHVNPSQPKQEWMPQHPFHAALPPLVDKDNFTWQQELVDAVWKSGQPELLRAVSTLTMTVVAALDTRNTLLDRQTHAMQDFGTGNAFLPPGSTGTTASLQQIHACLDRASVEKDWRERPDVLGMLLAAYSLLLRSAPSLASPRAGASPSNSTTGGSLGGIDLRSAWRMAFEAPSAFKSFSFGRFSLLPALQIPSTLDSSTDCNVSEFLLSVLADLASHYLDILVRNPFISRAKWLQDAEDDLRLRRSEQEQHRQFHSYMGTTSGSDSQQQLQAVPSSVDLMQRPDCLDDVLAFCVQVSRSDASSSARSFWKVQENLDTEHAQKNELHLSRAVSQMEKMQVQDESLRPVYLEMLASLALADGSDLAMDGASKVHALLSNPSNGEIPTQWPEIMETLRWFTRQLVQGQNARSSGGQSSSRSSSSSQQSTAYYYFERDTDPVGNGMSTKKSSSSSSTKTRELGKANTMMLQAHLSLIIAVALKSPDARAYLRALTLPIQGTDGLIGQDAMLMVLFTLAATPISPELRGQVFECIAAILIGSTEEEAMTAWQLVENSGFLPIYKLEQYPTDIREGVIVPGISFPPSSTARIVTDRRNKTWVPDDPTFSLIYEMEYIEAASGIYPSTGGFMKLLRALVVTGGCPSSLGDTWRVRAGCSPYIEYVLHLVLPRIMGTFSGGLPPLPFRSLQDKNQLLSTALEVTEVCITRFVVPESLTASEMTDADIQRSFTRGKSAAEKVLGLDYLADGVVVATTPADSKSFLYDFRSVESASLPKQSSQPTGSMVPNQRVLASPLPFPKSPGFVVLAEALIGSQASFFDVLAAALSSAVSNVDGIDADRLAMSYSLYGATPPTITSTKSRKKKSRSDILASLQESDRPSFEVAMKLRQRITSLAINILCAAASREDDFKAAMASSNIPTNIIPILRFQAKRSTPQAIDLQLSKVCHLLSARHLVTSLVECIGYNVSEEADFSPTSVTLFFYVQKWEKQNLRGDVLSAAFARRIWALSERCFDDPKEAQLLRVILDQILLDLRRNQLSPLLGSPNPSFGFEAIIGILKSTNFVGSQATSGMAAMCYEILYRCMIYPPFAKKMSSLQFWAAHFTAVMRLIEQYKSMSRTNLLESDVALSVSWILKGMTDELRSIVSSAVVAHVLPASRPAHYKRTLSLLFDDSGFFVLVYMLPLDQPVYATALSDALHVVLGGALLSCAALGDTIDTSQIIAALVEKLSVNVHPETARNLALCIYLATNHTSMSGEGIGRLAVVLAKAVGAGGVACGILASALELCMHRWSTACGLPDQAPFIRAATVLTRLACQVTDDFPVIPTSDALMARSCLKVLLTTVLDESTAHRILTDPGDYRHASPPINTFVSHLSKLDSNVPLLLHAIALLPFGTDLLVDSGVFRALDAAAEGYARHESQLETSTFQTPRIGPPAFWGGHLKLMSLMIAGSSENRKAETAGRVISVLSRYDGLSARLLRSFPSDGEETLAFFRCSSLAHAGVVESKLSAMSITSAPVTVYRTIAALTMHVAENPLPKALQAPLPIHLTRKKSSVDSDVVAVCQEDSTWWDKLNVGDTSPKLLRVCQCGIVGAQLVKTGLSVIRSSPAINKVDSRTLSHALCKTTDAVRFVDSISYNQPTPFFEESPGVETAQEAQKLRGELLDVVSELLRVTLMRVRQRNWSMEPSDWEDFREMIIFALDHTQLDSRGLLSPEAAASDENQPDHVMETAVALRNSLG